MWMRLISNAVGGWRDCFCQHQLGVLVYLVGAELMTKQGCDTRTKAVICFEPTWHQTLRRRLRHTARNQKIICSYTVENIEIFHHLMAALPSSLLRLSLPSRPCNYAHSRTLKPHSSNPVIFPGFFPLESFERRKKK